MSQKITPLPVGLQVTARRKNGELVRGVIAGPPIPHLLPIGEFYMIAKITERPAPFWRGSGRKSNERLRWEAEQGFIGMYAREKLSRA